MRITLATLLVAPLALAACTGDPPAAGTEGAFCIGDNNCLFGLRCVADTCQMGEPLEDAGVATPDAGVTPDAGGTPDAGMVGPPDDDEIAAGDVATTPEGEGLGYTLTGGAFLVRGADGRTSVRVELGGLNPATSYSVHVHVESCRTGGGPHYKIDPGIEDVVEANELWPSLESNADGWGAGYITVEHTARPEARSVVIHDPGDNSRIGCIDLNNGRSVSTMGTLAYFDGDPDPGYAGTVTMQRSSAGTTVQVDLTGALTADASYPVHVHEQTCADGKGGGHYKIDPTVTETQEANEIWPAVTANTAGDSGSGSAMSPHIARAKARSVVVHDPDTNDKVLCADLAM